MSLSKFTIAGVLAAGLGLATAAPADAQVIYTGRSVYPGGTFYVQPTPYVVPTYGYGYRSWYPTYGHGYRHVHPGFPGSRPWYPAYGSWYGPRRGFPGYYSPRPGFSFGFTIVR